MIPTTGLSGEAPAVAVAAQRVPEAEPDASAVHFQQIFEALSAGSEASGEPPTGRESLADGVEEATAGDPAALERALALLVPLGGGLQPVPGVPVPRREEAGSAETQDTATPVDPGVRWLGCGEPSPMRMPAPGGDLLPQPGHGADAGPQPTRTVELQRTGSGEVGADGARVPIASAAAWSAGEPGESGAPSVAEGGPIPVAASAPRLVTPAALDPPDTSSAAAAPAEGIARAVGRSLQSPSPAPPPDKALNPLAESLGVDEAGAVWSGQPAGGAVASGPVTAAEPAEGRPARHPDRPAPEPAPVADPPAGGTLLAATSLARGDARAAAAPRDPAPEALTVGSVERIQRAVRVAASGGVEVRVRLEPESLGEVRVAVRWDGGAVSARLEVGSPAAREALESHLPALRKSLQEQGIPIQQMDVGIRRDLGGGGREREPWRPAPGQESSRLDHPVERGEVHATEGTRSGVLDIRI